MDKGYLWEIMLVEKQDKKLLILYKQPFACIFFDSLGRYIKF